MELVEGDLGLGEVVGDPLDEGGTHVDAHLLDAAGIAVVGLQIVGERFHGIGAASLGDEQHAALVDIDEQRDVVVAAPGGGLVDGDALHVGVVGSLTGLLHPVVEDTPHPGVVLTNEAGCGSDRHRRHQRHGQRFEQQREAGTRPRPRHGDLFDAAVGARDARRSGVQERLMLEEVEMPPRLHRRVVHGAVSLGAMRTWETAASGEVDLDIEATRLGVEGAGFDHPRRDQPKSQLHQIGVAHRGLSGRPVEPRSCRRARARQGVAWKR